MGGLGTATTNQDTGGNIAVRIGERLDELDKQRQRAQDAKFLIQCWMEVSERGDLSTLEDVRRLGGGDGKVRCAQIARQLLKIGSRLDPERDAAGNGQAKRGTLEEEDEPEQDGVVNGGMNGGRKSLRRKVRTREVVEKFLEALEKDLLKQFDEFYRRQHFEGMRVFLFSFLLAASACFSLTFRIGMRPRSSRLQ